MRLASVALRDFRNFQTAELAISPRATVLVGQNGQGKTNLIEAVYFAATLRPLRAGRLAELIRFGRDRAEVSVGFERDGVRRSLAVSVGPEGKVASLDGKPARGLEEHLLGVAAVAFTPDDLAIVKGVPDVRRRALDRAVFNRWPAYLAESRDYQRSLRSRNRCLQSGAPAGERSAFEEALARLGARLWIRRAALLRDLAPLARDAFGRIAGPELELSLALAPAGVPAAALRAGEEALARALGVALEKRLARDQERGFTSAGPHADDLAIHLAGEPARTFASQGQQRAIVLALKLGEIEGLARAQGRPPLLLLDDISSELDPARSAMLLRSIRAQGAQALLTTTDLALVRPALDPGAQVVEVRSGALFQDRK